jgi:uncharacterized delta-60 repeat protein
LATSINTAPILTIGGIILNDINPSDPYTLPSAITQQSDGKLLVAGVSNYDIVLVRYNSDGSLDKSFSSDGIVTTDFGGMEEGKSVTVQTDGKILVASYLVDSSGFPTSIALVRYNSNGSLDTSFNTTGKVTTTINTTGYGGTDGLSTTVQSDGKILVTGEDENGYVLIRYNTDGSLDTSFGNSGITRTTAQVGYGGSFSIAVQSDNKILTAGASYGSTSTSFDFTLCRYNTNGSLDTSFSGDGKVTTDFSSGLDYGQSVNIQSDGKILVAGYTQNPNTGLTDFALARYNTNGSLDTSFSGDGKVTTNLFSDIHYANSFDKGENVLIQPDGKIIVAGSCSAGYNIAFGLVRYNTNGTLDTSFSADGIVTTSINHHYDGGSGQATAAVLQADGKIVVTNWYGSYNQHTDFALARYNSDGSLDGTFGGATTPKTVQQLS